MGRLYVEAWEAQRALGLDDCGIDRAARSGELTVVRTAASVDALRSQLQARRQGHFLEHAQYDRSTTFGR